MDKFYLCGVQIKSVGRLTVKVITYYGAVQALRMCGVHTQLMRSSG